MITVTMDNSWTYIDFPENIGKLKNVIEDRLHTGIGIKEDGYQYAKAYKMRIWDGITPFYKDGTFPTGLVNDVDEILGNLQNEYNFQYEIVDDRPDPLLELTDIPELIHLNGDITLRDYQMEAVRDIVPDRDGVLHLSTGCLPASANILTTKGYKKFSEILEESGIPEDSKEGYKGNPKGIKLINRYGKPEKPTDITVNGSKKTNEITTWRGYKVQSSDTHPLMTIDETGAFKWVEAKDLSVDDWVVLRKGDNVFGDNKEITKEDAYMLGLLIADGYIGIEERISFTNNQKELLEFFEEYFSRNKNLTVRKEKEKRGSEGTYDYTVQSKEYVTKYKDKFGLASVLSAEKEVPHSVRTASKEIQISFLTGYLECEMTIGADKGSKLGIEVTSASSKLLKQIHIMLLNLGIVSTLKEKVVKGYEHNWYGRIMVGAEDSERLLDLLSFKTFERDKAKEEFYEAYNKKKRNNQGQRVPYGKELARDYWHSSKTPHGQRRALRNAFYTPKYISKKRLKEGLEKYPDGDPELLDKLREIVKDEYVYTQVTEIEEIESEPTFDFHMPETNSYIAEGIINHNSGKSLTATGVIKIALDKLEAGETIGFFTHSKDLFKQTHKVLEDALGIRVGKVESGKYDIEKVNMVMIPTAASALKIDVEKGLNFTPKQMVIKKMATQITPKYNTGVNQRMLLKAYIQNFEIKTKADEAFIAEIEKVIKESESDAKCIFNLNKYTVWYNDLLKKKNEDKFKKKKKMKDFLNTVVMGIYDESHRIKGEGYYNVALACENALVKIGLTGSIDTKDKMLVQRLKSVFHRVSSVTRNKEMIQQGVLADVDVIMSPIRKVINDGEEVDISTYDWRDSYDYGIVKNEYRNALAAKMAQMWYERGEVVLVIVNRIEHGESISSLLETLGVKHRFIHGESGQESRDGTIQAVRDGELEVLISSTIIDEGVDIPNLSVLVNVAAGKSLRQNLQRVGRILRKKEDGRKAVVLDFMDRINPYLLDHSEQRLKIYEDEEFPVKMLEG